MAINQKDIDTIRDLFTNMSDKNDFMKVVNFAKRLLPTRLFFPFQLQQLTSQAYFKKVSRYSLFIIQKKDGTPRTIQAPNDQLKMIQKCLSIILEAVFNPHNAIHGFISNRSIVTNASVHTGQNYVYNIDLKDFFLSIDQARVWACFHNPPFNLQGEKIEIANLITALCCEELEVERLNENDEWVKVKKRVLPQGAPTSPILTNIVAQRLDLQLSKLAKRHNLKYTRYADDITFSSMHYVYKKNGEFILELENIIKEQGFHINAAKTRLQQHDHDRQIVTGLVVNEKVNISRKYIKDLRTWLYLLERHGYEYANKNFLINYKAKKLNNKGKVTIFDVLGGKLEYLKMVIGYTDDRYKKLYSRFEKQYDIVHPPQILEDKIDIVTEETTKSITPSKKEKINETPEKEPKKDIIDLSKHKPQEVTVFLSLFRSGELKWLTHELDKAGSKFDLKMMINNALTEFNSKSKQLIIPKSLYARINGFIKGSNNPKDINWSFNYKDYPFYWCSKDVEKWCQENPYLHPMRNEEYEKVINIFKSSIQVKRTLGSDLKTLITKVATRKFGSNYPKYIITYADGVDTAEFFTDVEKLIKGLGHIFNTIKQRPESKEIKIEFERIRTLTEDYRRLRIIHVKSELIEPLIDIDTSVSDMSSIKESLYQVCDWSLIANHVHLLDYNKINILYDVNKKQYKEKITENIEGFTHELIFYP